MFVYINRINFKKLPCCMKIEICQITTKLSPKEYMCSVAQLCLTLCCPTNYSPPDFSVHEIFQAGTLEWIVISSSRGFFQPRYPTSVPWSPALAGRLFTTNANWEAPNSVPQFIILKRREGMSVSPHSCQHCSAVKHIHQIGLQACHVWSCVPCTEQTGMTGKNL